MARPTSELSFTAEIIEWRGPAPFYYAPLPEAEAEAVREMKKLVSYGWGVIPVTATIGKTTFTTSLFPKDGTYLLPLKMAVRKQIGATVGDVVKVRMTLGWD